MATTDNLSNADPTNLEALRKALVSSDPDGKLAPVAISRIEIGPEALDSLTEVVTGLAQGRHVVLVADATPMFRNGEDLKERVARTLSESFELERAVIGTDRNAAGFGDTLATFTAPADWYLAYLMGMGDYHQTPVTLILEQAHELLDEAAALERREPEALYKLARVLTLTGIACSVAASTAPGSGTEHLVSHLLDMSAVQLGRPFAFHGAQVGVATVPVAAGWEALFDGLDPKQVNLDDCFPEPEEMEPVVREAFAVIDPSGGVGEECWSDYSKKIERWRGCRPQFESFLENWPRYRDELKELVVSPERLGNALKESRAPARFSELDPPIPEDTAFWALRNCHLMRNRFTLADLLFFCGWWDEAFVERLFERARSVGGGL